MFTAFRAFRIMQEFTKDPLFYSNVLTELVLKKIETLANSLHNSTSQTF